jgi:hypothetical protein
VENVVVGIGESGVPRSLLLGGVRYGVSDRPTRWSGRGDSWDFGPENVGSAWVPALWRFQATPMSEAGESIVVDVVETPGGWVLLGVVR